MPNSKETKTLPYRATAGARINHARSGKRKSPAARRGSGIRPYGFSAALLPTLAGPLLLLLLARLLARVAALLLLARFLVGVVLVLVILGHLISFQY